MNRLGTRSMRFAAGLLALILAAWSVHAYTSWARSRERLLALLTQFGTGGREPAVVSDVEREPDPIRARLLVARALLADELDRRWLADLDGPARERAQAQSLDKLGAADALAREVLAAKPASWQARMIVAGSTYLQMSRTGDPDRWRERARWEQPLLDATSMATSQAEPRRILAAAYLNDWSLMSPRERQSAREVLREAFRDRDTLEQLLPAWLRRADSLDQAFELIPDDLPSWQFVEGHFRIRQDWERVCDARTRALGILDQYLDKTISTAESRLTGRDPRGARTFALVALVSTPAGPLHAAILERVLAVLPAGPIPERYQLRTKEWLAWTRRECLLGNCPLPRAVAQRLRTLSHYETSADRAWTAELAGDVYTAEALERSALIPKTPEWTPYLLLKARRLALEDRPAEAAVTMTLIDADWADRAETRAVSALVRQGLGTSRDGQLLDWRSPTTIVRGESSLTEFYWQEPPEKIRLRFGSVAANGAAVELFWSDRFSGCYGIGSRATLTVPGPASGGFQLLEVRPVTGTRAGLAAIEIL